MADPKKTTPEVSPVGDQRDAEISMLKEKLALAEMELEERGSAPSGRQAEMLEFAKVIAIAVKEAIRPEAPGERTRPKPRALSAEHKGTKTYVVGPTGHYRANKLYKPGELVTVTDERPARDWKLAPGQDGAPVEKSSPPLSRPLASKRASDADVG